MMLQRTPQRFDPASLQVWRWQVSRYNADPDAERKWEPVGTVRASTWRAACAQAHEAFPGIPEIEMCVVRLTMETVR